MVPINVASLYYMKVTVSPEHIYSGNSVCIKNDRLVTETNLNTIDFQYLSVT